jgi:mono/diheme cytochrome c family protein
VLAGSAILAVLVLAGCEQRMARQPYYRPLEPSKFFSDGMSARPVVPGTVARGTFLPDPAFTTGKVGVTQRDMMAARVVGMAGRQPFAAAALTMQFDGHVDTIPVEVSKQVLLRGQERFNIFCSHCHDRAGTGDGMIVRRGFARPPSLHIDRLRQAPPGYLFQVITRGHGAMPEHGSLVPVRDRWAVVAYIRALQLSRNARLDDVPEGERPKLEGKGGKKDE